ncbi:hypothetical protein LOTGIDRAFT_171256 [Lottia gigantea]|uniref:Uncharacterized protein n=1 Tax=Lottia gigantea TaxID=225164 RepID=V4B7M8_LOTGI|nr:hypothetical protein LOTGIDRAFT_171256 [Lottia gigantea]ESP03606.1 hypothetical protein LOTGIDRAFT_171256 [Lottia gigantea]
MSVQEPDHQSINTTSVENGNNKKKEFEGACGGKNPKPQIDQLTDSMVDDGTDNISMEVHLGEDSSRHPSEISSISYQNLLEDGENASQVVSRRDSEDSIDSYPPDDGDNYFPADDVERFEASDLPISERYKKPPEPKSLGTVNTDVEINIENVSEAAIKSKSDQNDDTKELSSASKHQSSIPSFELSSVPTDTPTPDEGVILRKKITSEHASVKDPSDPREMIKKRNSLEIRNNIPTVGEVKSYDKDLEDLTYSSQGAKPKIRKQSPGLARRVCETPEREGSSSEREMEQTQIKDAQDSEEQQEAPGMQIECRRVENGISQLLSQQRRPMDIENEYDYVKYARVQQGNSYVGMRLAYSSSNDSLNIKRNSMNSQETASLESSRETSPEKILQKKILQDLDNKAFQGQVNEDSLIEIPLNGLDSNMSEDKKSFTLSPENTECDSVEVESVMSDGERGMPTVEDGLSSSQASDYEDNGERSAMKQKNKSENSHQGEKPKKIDAQAIMTDLKAKREALDSAIADIKCAIQQSKGVALQSSKYSTEPQPEEPIWVMR